MAFRDGRRIIQWEEMPSRSKDSSAVGVSVEGNMRHALVMRVIGALKDMNTTAFNSPPPLVIKS